DCVGAAGVMDRAQAHQTPVGSAATLLAGMGEPGRTDRRAGPIKKIGLNRCGRFPIEVSRGRRMVWTPRQLTRNTGFPSSWITLSTLGSPSSPTSINPADHYCVWSRISRNKPYFVNP